MRLSRLRHKRLLILAALLTSGVCLFVYAAFIEPYRIEVTRHQIAAPLQTPVKIAHLSDLHTYGIGKREQRMLALLEAEKPDLIVITGDLVSDAQGYDGLLEVLRRLRAPLGVFVVRGNHENWHPVDRLKRFGDFKTYFEAAGAHYLFNSSRQAREDLWLIGLDDQMTGKPDLEQSLAGVPEAAYTIALYHSPAFFDKGEGKFELAFAGHSHGGQIRLPFVKPFWLPVGCDGYVEGWYERDGAKMYVSRGLGTSILDVRFNCRPEIAIITLG